MTRIAGLAALNTLAVVAITQAICYALWRDIPGGYPLAIVLTGVAIPAVTCFPVSFLLLHQRRKLADSLVRLRAAHILLEQQSARDPMTGLLHRHAFMQRLPQRRRETEVGTFLMIDVDRFKAINDTYGHSAGDAALKLVAEAIESAAAGDDLLARFGGEEFCVYSPGAGPEDGRALAERIRIAIARIPFAPRDTPHPLTASIGLAYGSVSMPDDRLLEEADAALYEAKRTGRNRVVSHRPMRLERLTGS